MTKAYGLQGRLETSASHAAAWRPHAWRILALWVVALACYSNSFHAGMVGDDVPIIEGDARVRAMSSENVRLAFTEEYWYGSRTTGLYRPFTTLTYLFNYAVLGNGNDPAGYHAVNFAIHAANIALAYLLGLLLFGAAVPAIGLAALWGIHPVLTESVTNLVGRADLLAAFGVLAGLLCHVRAAESSGRRRRLWLAALGVSAAIGIFSKENAVVLPAAMLVYDAAFGRKTGWRSRWRGYAAVGVPFALFFGLRAEMLAHHPAGSIPFVDNPLVGLDFWTARLTALKLIASDLRLLFWPARLSADYSFHQVEFATWGDWQMLAGTGFCLLSAALAVAAYRRNKAIFFLLAFFFAALAPVSNLLLIIGATIAERFLYLPAVGMAGCLVAAGCEVLRRFPRGRWALAGILAVLCAAGGARTFARNRDWANSRTLWTSAAAVTPEAFRPHYSLAAAFAEDGQLDAAVRESEKMMAILDRLPDRWNSMRAYEMAGECFRRKGDSAGAASAAWYRRALDALLRAEKFGAIEREQIRQANLAQGRRAVVPLWPALYLEIGRTYLRLNRPQAAIAMLTEGRGAREDPAFDAELSNAYRQAGDLNRAAVALIEGLVIDSNATSLAAQLARLYHETAPESCAIRSGAGGVTIDMECPMVHGQVCTATWNVADWYAKSGRTEQARATAASAVNQLQCPPRSTP